MNSGIKPIGIRRAQIALAAALTCLAGSALADQTHVTYTLAAGASKVIPVPAVNTPVQMSCTQNTVGTVGEGQATVIRSTTDNLLDWVGFDYYSAAITRGFSASAGTHMIYCDFDGGVDIEVANASEIQVTNKSSGTQTGVVMFVF
jgi:hypothetical protein